MNKERGFRKWKGKEIGDRPDWHEYFMMIAIIASTRSSCLNVQSGSVFVKDNHIIGTGYNGASSRRGTSCLLKGCEKENKGLIYEESLNSGQCIGIHSEMNGMRHSVKESLEGSTLYTTVLPCHDCAKNLASYDVEKIYFKKIYSEKEIESTKEYFRKENMEVFQLDMSPERFFDVVFNYTRAKVFSPWTKEERERMRELIKK